MAQNGGSARAYLVGLSRRRRSYHPGRPPRDGKRCSHTYPDYAALTTLGHAAWGAFFSVAAAATGGAVLAVARFGLLRGAARGRTGWPGQRQSLLASQAMRRESQREDTP
jgi:hypothetical protein